MSQKFVDRLGNTFLTGLSHLGVVKALNGQGLLPRIISGTAIGALIAALVCIHTDDELPVSIKHRIRFQYSYFYIL